MAQKSVVVIGSGFAGLSAASFMAKEGWNVTVLEKNKTAGGRARQLKEMIQYPAVINKTVSSFFINVSVSLPAKNISLQGW